MSFAFFLRSLRSQLFGAPTRRARQKKTKRPTGRRPLKRLALEGLEDRTLLSAAPTPLVELQQTIAASASSATVKVNFDSPAIAVDPTNAQRMAAVYINHTVAPNSD